MTVVYIDLLFLLNLVANYLLLLAGGRLAGTVLRRGWMALGAALGALYACVLFLPGCQWLSAWPCRVAAGVVMAVTAYGTGRQLLRGTLLFFAASAALAGLVLAAELLGSGPLTMLGGVYYSRFDLRLLLVLFVLCYFILSLFFRRLGRHGGGELVRLDLRLFGKDIHLTALRDTGNTLTDPATNRPVVVVDQSAVKPCLPRQADPSHPVESVRQTETFAGKQFGSVFARARAIGDIELELFIVRDDFTNRVFSTQIIDDRPPAAIALDRLDDRRVAQVKVDQDDLIALIRKAERQIGRNGRFPLIRHRARHQSAGACGHDSGKGRQDGKDDERAHSRHSGKYVWIRIRPFSQQRLIQHDDRHIAHDTVGHLPVVVQYTLCDIIGILRIGCSHPHLQQIGIFHPADGDACRDIVSLQIAHDDLRHHISRDQRRKCGDELIIILTGIEQCSFLLIGRDEDGRGRIGRIKEEHFLTNKESHNEQEKQEQDQLEARQRSPEAVHILHQIDLLHIVVIHSVSSFLLRCNDCIGNGSHMPSAR